MKNSDLVGFRLRHQHLIRPKFETPEQVVGWLAAVQAQDYAGAKWALGQRLHGVTEADIEQAFTTGAILRTHLLRPTWHFIAPADIRWMLALTAPRVEAASAYMFRKAGLDHAIFKRSHSVLVKALRGGHQLTRDELREKLKQAGLATEGEQRMSYLMMKAELDGVICSGARRGKQFTYALLEERTPPAKTFDRDEALAELSRRYFMSRGPATVYDFSKWSGLTITEAKRGLAAVQHQFNRVTIAGQAYWLAESTPRPTPATPTAHLLSIYDEYISGYKDRSAISDPDHAARLQALGNDLTAIILVNGYVVGTWKRALQSGSVSLELTLFTSLSQAETRAIEAAAQRYGVFLNRTVALTYLANSKSKRKGKSNVNRTLDE